MWSSVWHASRRSSSGSSRAAVQAVPVLQPTRKPPHRTPHLRNGDSRMAVERTPSGSSLIDVLDRVLDKGIVIDAWVRVSLVGIDLVTVEARIVVASIDTYLKYSEAVGITAPISRPRELSAGDGEFERMKAENAELRRQLSER